MDRTKKPVVVCFGESLFDIFPNGKKAAGGAPMNVAYHLGKAGIVNQFVSRVGEDNEGKELLAEMRRLNIPKNLVQIDSTHSTGKVLAKMDKHFEMTYDIVRPAAWDFIEYSSDLQNTVKTADAFVFGSLAARNEVSFKTLFSLLEKTSFKVFDINLRPPHYTRELVFHLLEKTDLLKLNEHELALLAEWMRMKTHDETRVTDAIRGKYGINEIVLTKGAEGAVYFRGKERIDQPACKVEVEDTVGSGDAFLAAMLTGKFLSHDSMQKQLKWAAALAAFVASKKGACPDYTQEDIKKLMSSAS